MKWPLLNRHDEVVAFTQIDEVDLPLVSSRRWSLSPAGYAVAAYGVKLHRLILGAKGKISVDHQNGDRLDNRRANLRLATTSQNCRNSAVPRGRNPHRGISWEEDRQRWHAQIKVDNRTIHLGRYTTVDAALAARVKAEKEYFGEFAPIRLNVRSA